jgi:endonuclease-3
MARESKAGKQARALAVAERMNTRYPAAQCALHHRDAFELLVAVVLSAQTTDAAVNKVTPELFGRWPNAEALASADTGELSEVIRGIGLYRVKAANCVKLSRMLLAEHDGQVPHTMAELTALPGVGRKTANIVLNNAFGIVEGIAVDTHVFRIAHKLGFSPATHDSAEKVERDLLAIYPQELWGPINHQWVLFGREVCIARRPRCSQCPLSDLCPSAELAVGD